MQKSPTVLKPITKTHRKESVKICHTIIFYFPWLLKEMLISSFEVAKLILMPKKVAPQIVQLGGVPKSKAGRLIYANSITLTPGTLTIEVEKESFIVHYLVEPDKDDKMKEKIRGILC